MPRFRVAEDERKYIALRTEMYLRIIQNVPPQVASEIMRNFGKLETLLHFEGVKQGLAVASVGLAGDLGEIDGLRQLHLLPPAEALARVYADADTPLAEAEKRWMAKLDQTEVVNEELPRIVRVKPGSPHEDLPWLSIAPVELPPMTLTEALAKYGPDLDVSAPVARRPSRDRVIGPQCEHCGTEDHPEHGCAGSAFGKRECADKYANDATLDVSDPLTALDELAASDDPLAAIAKVEMPDLPNDQIPVESPAGVERIRESISQLMGDGWKPESWDDLILKLHVAMRVDAFWLDIQLSSEVGRTMLSQLNLHLHPGAAVQFAADFRTT